MKKQIGRWVIAGLLISSVILLFTQCEQPDSAAPDRLQASFLNLESAPASSVDMCHYLVTTYPEESLTDSEKEALLFMREEEKLARDVYLELYGLWGSKVFNNISQSEQRHMDAVRCLLERYGLDDPAADKDAGVFVNTELQGLYDDLMQKGKESPEDALIVGALIEEVDIEDLESLLDNQEMDNQDLRAVFKNLNLGSRNHLRAFTKNLTNLGITYTPQVLSAERFEAIITSPQERGSAMGGTCTGQQKQRNKGKGANSQGKNRSGNCDGSGQ